MSQATPSLLWIERVSPESYEQLCPELDGHLIVAYTASAYLIFVFAPRRELWDSTGLPQKSLAETAQLFPSFGLSARRLQHLQTLHPSHFSIAHRADLLEHSKPWPFRSETFQELVAR